MPFYGRTAASVFCTPQDEDADHGLIERTLRGCFQASKGPCVFSEFGAQWSVLWEEVGLLLDRGVRVTGVLDHVQFAGPSEQRVVHPFIASHPEPWKTQDIVVGTSMDAGQILHDKKTIWNAPLFGYQPPVGDYETVEEALAAGACVSWFGSLNLSSSASKQANTICILPGIIVGTMFVSDIMANRDFILSHQQRFQPFPSAA